MITSGVVFGAAVAAGWVWAQVLIAVFWPRDAGADSETAPLPPPIPDKGL
jgi:hypothetical protein